MLGIALQEYQLAILFIAQTPPHGLVPKRRHENSEPLIRVLPTCDLELMLASCLGNDQGVGRPVSGCLNPKGMSVTQQHRLNVFSALLETVLDDASAHGGCVKKPGVAVTFPQRIHKIKQVQSAGMCSNVGKKSVQS
ncbi:hypothetical protein FALCPG4_006163 [Fusarium falciforme]